MKATDSRPAWCSGRIRQKSAVLSFKGWQYEVMF